MNEQHYAMTHREIGEAMGISHQRVEQIERNALKKLSRRMAQSVKPPQPTVASGEESWERKYDRLYREVKKEAA